MLTDKEREQIWNELYPDEDRLSYKVDAYAEAIERAVLAKAVEQEPVNDREYKAHEWWRVEVKLYDGTLLAIEPEMLAGKSDLTGRDEETIRAAGRHLLAFIGDPLPAQAIPQTTGNQICRQQSR